MFRKIVSELTYNKYALENCIKEKEYWEKEIEFCDNDHSYKIKYLDHTNKRIIKHRADVKKFQIELLEIIIYEFRRKIYYK